MDWRGGVRMAPSLKLRHGQRMENSMEESESLNDWSNSDLTIIMRQDIMCGPGWRNAGRVGDWLEERSFELALSLSAPQHTESYPIKSFDIPYSSLHLSLPKQTAASHLPAVLGLPSRLLL